jgi:hypothetical protein
MADVQWPIGGYEDSFHRLAMTINHFPLSIESLVRFPPERRFYAKGAGNTAETGGTQAGSMPGFVANGCCGTGFALSRLN